MILENKCYLVLFNFQPQQLGSVKRNRGIFHLLYSEDKEEDMMEMKQILCEENVKKESKEIKKILRDDERWMLRYCDEENAKKNNSKGNEMEDLF